MENKNIIDLLLEKLEKIDNGVYHNDSGIRIDVHRGRSTIEFNDGIPKSNTPRIDVSYNENGILVEIVLDKKSTLYIYKGIFDVATKTYILTTRENKVYNIDKTLIRSNQEFFHVQNDILYKKIDNTCWLGYDLTFDKPYMYYSKKVEKNIKPFEAKDDECFIKFEYNEDFFKGLEKFNKILFDFFKELKKPSDEPFKELAQFVLSSLPKVNYDVSSSRIELRDLGKIYNIYKNELALGRHESELTEVYNFVQSVIIDPEEATKNNIKHMIENIDLNNKDELIKLRTEIDNILKLKKKTKKLKI